MPAKKADSLIHHKTPQKRPTVAQVEDAIRKSAGNVTYAGMELYNEAILVTAVGSLSIRVGRQFEAGRKLGKTHQNVLVFVKGDPRKATAWCGPVEIGTLEDELEGADEVGA